MKTPRDMKVRSARAIAPEDLRAGQYVTVTRVQVEETPLLCDPAVTKDMPILRAWLLPYGAGDPLRIVSVCLPFVLVETTERRCRTLDLRRMEIARLPKRYGREAFERLARTVQPGE